MTRVANFDPEHQDALGGSVAVIAASAAAAAMTEHGADVADAHEAMGINLLDAGEVTYGPFPWQTSGVSNVGHLEATDVEGAIAEIAGALGMVETPVTYGPLPWLTSGLGPGRIAHEADVTAHAAGHITIEDAGGYYAATDVEAALAEIAAATAGANAELNIEGGQDLINALGTIGAGKTVDPTLGNVFTGTLNQDGSVTLSTPVGTGQADLYGWITQDGGGGHVITFLASGGGSITMADGADSPDTTAGVTVRYLCSRIPGTTNDWVINLVGAGAALTVKDEGTPLATAATSLDFVGAGVTVSGTGAAKTVAIPGGASSPLTTKGDLWGYDTANARVPVGTTGYPLVADPTDAQGVAYGPIGVVAGYPFHAEPLTDGASNFIFAGGDIVVVVGVPN